MTSTGEKNRMLVAGLGNLLMGDDGVGVHAVRELLRDPPPGADVHDFGTGVWHLESFLESAERVLAIDAVQAGGRPGTVYRIRAADMAAASAAGASLHRWSLPDMLRSRAPEDRPLDVLILGVEPQRLEYGTELSPAVKAAMPEIVREARRIVAAWAAGAAAEDGSAREDAPAEARMDTSR